MNINHELKLILGHTYGGPSLSFEHGRFQIYSWSDAPVTETVLGVGFTIEEAIVDYHRRRTTPPPVARRRGIKPRTVTRKTRKLTGEPDLLKSRVAWIAWYRRRTGTGIRESINAWEANTGRDFHSYS